MLGKSLLHLLDFNTRHNCRCVYLLNLEGQVVHIFRPGWQTVLTLGVNDCLVLIITQYVVSNLKPNLQFLIFSALPQPLFCSLPLYVTYFIILPFTYILLVSILYLLILLFILILLHSYYIYILIVYTLITNSLLDYQILPTLIGQ
jgi:hypothetical protein